MTISNWNPNLSVSPGTTNKTLNGYLTTPFAGGTGGSGPTPPPNLPTGARLVLVPGSIQSTGGTVTGWNDVSGFFNNLTVTGSPTVGSIGSNAAVTFSGAQSLQTTTGAVPISVVTGFTQFIVFVSVASQTDLLYNGDIGVGNYLTGFKAGAGLQSSITATDFGVNGIVLDTVSNTPAATPTILWARGQLSSPNNLVTIGQTGDTTGSGSYNYMTDVSISSGRVTVGTAYPSSSFPFVGQVSCVVEYAFNLTDAQVTQVLAALAAYT